MIYPQNFELKIGFGEVRQLLANCCLSTMGRQLVDSISFSTHEKTINEWLEQIREFRHIEASAEDFPLHFFFDMRPALLRSRIENTHLEEEELFNLRRSLATVTDIVAFLNTHNGDGKTEKDIDDDGWQHAPNYLYPALHRLSEDIMTFPKLISRIDQILDRYGRLRDTASPELTRIRRELARTESSISRTLQNILQTAQHNGLIEKDTAPTLRDGRLVIPITTGLKRKIQGIVHDESATGKTSYIEPTEVVEANNRITELKSEQRQEIIRILTEVTRQIRPQIQQILPGYNLLAQIDFIRAKAHLAEQMQAYEPIVEGRAMIDWIRAIHPLLQRRMVTESSSTDDTSIKTIYKEKSQVVPLDITLTDKSHILIISGPNAGGKSVCLKTVGLLQYMVQCGLSIPVGDRSKVGIFNDIMIDIGDEQSLDNDLSTYSSHLLNMKYMMKQASAMTLLLIDEFGTGTEPQIGGAIAEAVLERFCQCGAWGIITTHYQNLKHFADSHEGTVNGAMLYDRHEMRPLFQLAIGRPGSSFAIEIARKIGLPEEVIQKASNIVGSEYIQSDKYLQDIVRDKRYWEQKRQSIHLREKEMEKTLSRYQHDLEEVERQRKEILHKAQLEAEELLKETNKRIENTIREIKEQQAAREQTRQLRHELKEFEHTVSKIDTQAKDDAIARKITQIKQRKERHLQHLQQKATQQEQAAASLRQISYKTPDNRPLLLGDTVRIKGTNSVGQLETINGKIATVIFGGIRSKTQLSKLEHASATTDTSTKKQQVSMRLGVSPISHETRQTIDEHKSQFHQDLDVRGLRGDEALNEVQHFIDDAILVGMDRVRILHGKGNGILRQLIRQYLSSVPNISHFADEHVQFGGSGITVVDIG